MKKYELKGNNTDVVMYDDEIIHKREYLRFFSILWESYLKL